MRPRALEILLASALVAAAQTPQSSDQIRSKAADYPVHTASPVADIGAEYLVRSVPGPHGFYFAENYLVVEIGFFPSTPQGVMVSNSHFMLRVNGKKAALFSQTYGMVAADIKNPDNENTNPLTMGSARFPGDPNAPQPRNGPMSAGGVATQEISVDDAVKQAALPEGQTSKPVRGCLFFPYHPKTKTIKSLELIYDNGAGAQATLSLM